jgi:hypothetical protein
MAKMRWRPIAECPPTLTRTVVFDPENAGTIGVGQVDDERVSVADRRGDGVWHVDDCQGGYDIEPTHFLDPGVPEGFPATLDPEAVLAREEAERAERERRWREEAEAAAKRPPEAAVNLGQEAYWSDPDNLRRFLSGQD